MESNNQHIKHQLDAISQLSLVADSHLWSEAERKVVNFCLVAMLLEYDLFIVLDDFQATSDPDRQKYYVRQLAVVFIDLFDNLFPMLGTVVGELRQSAPSSAITHDMSRVHKHLNEIRKACEKQLRRLRNTVGAHRDKNAAAQLEALKSINVSDAASLTKELLDAFVELSTASDPEKAVLGCAPLAFEPIEPLEHTWVISVSVKNAGRQGRDYGP